MASENDARIELRTESVKNKDLSITKFIEVGVNKKVSMNRIFTHSASVWSNASRRNDPKLLPARLVNANFRDLLDLCVINGVEVVQKTLKSVRKEMKPMQYSIESEMLKNIAKGIKHARKN